MVERPRASARGLLLTLGPVRPAGLGSPPRATGTGPPDRERLRWRSPQLPWALGSRGHVVVLGDGCLDEYRVHDVIGCYNGCAVHDNLLLWWQTLQRFLSFGTASRAFPA